MSARLLGKRYDRYEALEKLINSGAVSVQRAEHTHIIELGDRLEQSTRRDTRQEVGEAVQQALQDAHRRHTRELRAATARLRHQLQEQHAAELQAQTQGAQRLAEKVARSRDALEEEHLREQKQRLDEEKRAALAAQWEECERVITERVRAARVQIREELRAEHERQREAAVQAALTRQAAQLKKEQEQAVRLAQEACRTEAARAAAEVARQHQQEITWHEERFRELTGRYSREHQHRVKVEEDFRALQQDYKLFMDYTDGQFHSDYLMILRHLGDELAGRKLSTVTFVDPTEKDNDRDAER